VSGRRQVAVVTGAAGFIGCNLAARLFQQGWAVKALDNERSGDWRRLTVPVERVDHDLTSLSGEELVALCDGAEALFHLAAEKHNSSKTTPQRTIEVNVLATQRLFDAAASVGVRKVVFTSSLYAYGAQGPDCMTEDDLPAPTTLYGVSKVAGEHLLRVAGQEKSLGWTAARLFFIYGPKQYAEGGYKSVIVKNFERIRRGESPVIFGDGEQALDYVYVDDCVDALLAMLAPEHDGCTYNVATGHAITVNELTRLMLEVSGSDLEPVTGPVDETAGTTRKGSPALAQSRLAWHAETPIDVGLRRVWAWLEGT
jgi:nucleoside-diphosphate-sugar epimerase